MHAGQIGGGLVPQPQQGVQLGPLRPNGVVFRAEFERRKTVEYSIQTISGKDLEITKENDRVVISYKYDSEVPLFGPVSLLFHYAGRSK